MQNLTQILHDHYVTHPDQVALVMLNAAPWRPAPDSPIPGLSERPIAYRQLLEGANAYAQTFAAVGLQP